MNKQEFLNILKATLSGEISESSVEDNISFYNHYISTNRPGNEDETILELGDPRLIAKTIIETERLSKNKNKYGEDFTKSRSYQSDDRVNNHEPKQESIKNIIWSNLSLIQKVLIIVVLVVTVVIIFFLARVFFRLIAVFGFPILVIYLLYRLFKRR